MNFLEKLDLLMGEMSINKSKLSQISGVPYTTIDGFYKKGYENTKISTIRKIASALNVSLDYLVDDNVLERNFAVSSKYVFRLKIHMGCGSLKIHAGSAMGLTTSTLIPRASMILKNRPTPGSTYPFSILEI